MTAPLPTRPQPVVTAATIGGFIGAVVTFAVTLGLLSADEGNTLNGAVQALLAVGFSIPAILAPVLAAFHARSKVTPLSDPVDADGRQLIAA